MRTIPLALRFNVYYHKYVYYVSYRVERVKSVILCQCGGMVDISVLEAEG